MAVELTRLSANEYERLLSGDMTPRVAAEYLRGEHIIPRNFGDILKALYPEGDITEKLTTEFTRDSDRASASRKVSNWITGKNRPTSREDIFRIAFALTLSEQQTSLLLGHCTDYMIHYRDSREVIYAWFIRNGKSYDEAREFYESLPPPPSEDPSSWDHAARVTQKIRSVFLQAQNKDELRAAYTENISHFGTLHLRAFYYLQRYMDQLLHPYSEIDGVKEADYSLETVMELYFQMHIPSSRSRSGYSVTQKLVKQNWPNTTTLKDIYARRRDVPRKLLLLLYVITENVLDKDYNEFDEDYTSDEERIEDHWWTMNALLTDCSMPTLDLRNASDWLMMYAVTATDEAMSEKLEQTIEYMFFDVNK